MRDMQARKNRAENPEAAAFVDAVRAAFGPDVKVTYYGPIRERHDPSEPEREWSEPTPMEREWVDEDKEWDRMVRGDYPTG